jgi:hypothetical protein
MCGDSTGDEQDFNLFEEESFDAEFVMCYTRIFLVPGAQRAKRKKQKVGFIKTSGFSRFNQLALALLIRMQLSHIKNRLFLITTKYIK